MVDDNGQMVLGSGDSYQTVTIVPSETPNGEVSYVLIVQQNKDANKELKEDDQDLTVYDFDDHEEPSAVSGAVSRSIWQHWRFPTGSAVLRGFPRVTTLFYDILKHRLNLSFNT